MSVLLCRLCAQPLTTTFVDLGMSPPCERFLTPDEVDRGETFYPLNVRVCDSCLLVQLPAYVAAEEIFTDYAYFSSFSDSWVAHAKRFVDEAVSRLGLGPDSFVVEVASNDGYLLQHVVARGIAHWASSRPKMSPKWRFPAECPLRSPSSASAPPQGLRENMGRPTLSLPTTSWPTCRTSSTSPKVCVGW